MSVRLKQAAYLVTKCEPIEPRLLVALEHLEGGMGRLSTDVALPESMPPESGVASVEPGDVLFGKLRPYLAKTWLADRPVFASTELLCLRPRADVEGRWLAYAVASRPVVEWAVATSDGTKMPRTSWEKLAEFRLDIPSLVDQRAIADHLDRETARIDAVIEKKQTLTQRLSERRQALITAAVQGDIGPGVASRGDGVRWRRLKRYCDGPPEYGLNVSSDAYVDEGYRLLRTTDIDDAGALSPESEGVCVGRHLVDPRHVLIPGDLLFSRAGSLGRCFRVPQEARDLTFAGYLVRFRPLPMVDPRYIQYCVAAGFVQASIIADAVTSTISNFNAERYGNLLLPEKDPKQQRAIADYLDQETACIDALIDKINRQIDLLQEHRQALITAAVTGDLDIPGVAA